MADGGRRSRRGVGFPGRPRLGSGWAVRSGSRRGREVVHQERRLPGIRGRFRRGVFRDRTQRGAGDGSTTALAVGGVVGSLRKCRDRPGELAGFGDGRVRRGFPWFVRRPGALRTSRFDVERGLRAGGVFAGSGRPGRLGGYRMFVVVGGAASCGTVAALRRVRPGSGWWGDGNGHPGHVRGVQSATGAVS